MKISLGWLYRASVFLTMLGAVSIYTLGPIHIRPYQIPLIFAVIIHILSSMKNATSITVPKYTIWLLLFISIVIISIANAAFPLFGIKQLILLFSYVFLFFGLSRICINEQELIFMHKAILLSCFVCCVYGIYMLIQTNMPGVPKEGGYLYTRPKAFFKEPNEFGQYLVFAFGYVFSEYISDTKIVNKRYLKIIYILLTVILIINMSRGAWLGNIVSAFIVLHYQNISIFAKMISKKLIKVLVIFTLLLITTLVSVSIIKMTDSNISVGRLIVARSIALFKGKDPTAAIRLNNNLRAMNAVFENPIIGIGFGNMFSLYGNSRYFEGNNNEGLFATSSNLFSDICAETGILGLFLFILFLIALFKHGKYLINNAKNPLIRNILIGAFASFVGLLVNGLTYSCHLLPFLWISAGIIAVRLEL